MTDIEGFNNDVLERMEAAVLLIDGQHRIQWMNAKAADWFGIRGIGMRRTCYRTQSYGPGICNICPTGRAIEHHTPAHYEFSITKEDSQKKYEVIAVPVRYGDADSVSVLEIVMDVTEKGVVKIKENEIMAQIEKLAGIGQLAAGIAHELNTPLGTISIISDELDRVLDGAGRKNVSREIIKEYLVDMKGEIARCKTIIHDLLGFAKSGPAYVVETEVNAVVAKTVDFIRKGKVRSGIGLEFEPDADLPSVMTDPDRFRQVVFNVIKNAVEAVDDAGRVSVATRFDGSSVTVVVRDDGQGVPKEHLKRVFEPFFSTKPVGKGTGLGLSVSYGIMRDLRGEIRFESERGKGTVVSLILPAQDGNDVRPSVGFRQPGIFNSGAS